MKTTMKVCRTVTVFCLLALVGVNASPILESAADSLKVGDHDAIVAHINAHGKWKATVYPQLAGLSAEEIQMRLGDLDDPAPHVEKSLKPGRPAKTLVDAPESFNAIEKWPQCADVIGEIRDQSSCGSCWAVAVGSVLSDRLCIASNGKYKHSISALDMMACCSWCGDQCNGGRGDAAFEYFVDYGIVTGSNYTADLGCKPYPIPPTKPGAPRPPKPSRFQCQKSCVPGYTDEPYAKDHWYGKEAQKMRTEEEMIAELIENGPIHAAFVVYEDFLYYKSGIYEHVWGGVRGGHAVRVVGYGVENGKKYWKVANSWNKWFGEDGYFKIRRGANECTFETRRTGSATLDLDRSTKDKY